MNVNSYTDLFLTIATALAAVIIGCGAGAAVVMAFFVAAEWLIDHLRGAFWPTTLFCLIFLALGIFYRCWIVQ